MQFNCYDYYEGDYDTGCCLKCSKSQKGCFCFDCKCKKCYWYSEGSRKGYCDKVEDLKEQRKKKFIKNIQEQEEEEYKKSQELKKFNNQEEKRLKKIKKIAQTYTCQRCKRWFVSEEDKIIIINKEPRCMFCDGSKRSEG